MPLRDLLRKKEKVEQSVPPAREEPPPFLFYRSDTQGQELISPPSFAGDLSPAISPVDGAFDKKTKGGLFARSRSASINSATSTSSRVSDTGKREESPKARRLSQRLHLKKSQPTSASVPSDLPDIQAVSDGDSDGGTESQWEKRATMLAQKNESTSGRPTTPIGSPMIDLPSSFSQMALATEGAGNGVVSSQNVDDNIQEAIRLHEAGELELATKMFGRMADPNGGNNALSQVLYGLALRHGWGCTPNPSEAVKYLSAAASNAAGIEEMALKAGMKKGGAAKGELVLAIFELANCFRHGWGVSIDKFAAKQYYETAANLGDTDAMNEVGWCYNEGFGCKKDRFAAARYYRLAEAGGSKTLGNTWIWKEKYDPPGSSSSKPGTKK